MPRVLAYDTKLGLMKLSTFFEGKAYPTDIISLFCSAIDGEFQGF